MELWSRKKRDLIVIVGKSSYGDPFHCMGRVTCSISSLYYNPEKVLMVVFTGGEDIHPFFYAGKSRGISYTNIRRDRYERLIFKHCQHHGIKMAGICRGIQLFNVMAGGFMYQHIRKHTKQHKIIYPALNRRAIVTSTHHQLIGIPSGAMSIAWASPRKSNIYIGPNCGRVYPPDHEIEVAVYPKFNALGVQFHPEAMRDGTPGKELYRAMMVDFINLPLEHFIKQYAYKERQKNEETQTATV